MQNIFSNDGSATGGETYSWSRKNKDYRFVQYGRCRSGKRWFWAVWAAASLDNTAERHGWADTEDAAITAARAAVEEIADRTATLAGFSAKFASAKLKELTAAKRAARPASKAKGSAFVQYISRLFASFEDTIPKRDPGPEAPDLLALKMQMAAAHPDRGGTSADFIAARKRYMAAKRKAATLDKEAAKTRQRT
jgi:hypothetical protein